MPGLFGLICSDPTDLRTHLERMGQALYHGSEQVRDRWISETTGVALGRESLGIFNPEPQPIHNRDQSLAIVMEGEFFETDTLRQALQAKGHHFPVGNDPELALHVYEEYGPDALAELRGLFVLAIWDTRQRQLVLTNDRYGLRNLYIAQIGGQFIFASEIRGILSISGVRRVVDDEAVAGFFAFGDLPGNKTFFQNVQLLPPATILTVRDSNVTMRRYWSLEYTNGDNSPSDEALIEEMSHLLRQAVRRRMNGRFKVGLSLSGGLDSTTLLAAIGRAHYPLHTFTYGQPGSRDVRRAHLTTQRAGTIHHFLELEPDYAVTYAEETVCLTEGMLNYLDGCHGLHLRAMRDYCQVMLLGNGGDSFFALYRSFHPQIRVDSDWQRLAFEASNVVIPEADAPALFTDKYHCRIQDRPFALFQVALAEMTPNMPDNLMDAYRLREHIRRMTGHGLYTINNQLEYREPYYDYDLVDFALTVPPRLRQDRCLHRRVLERIAPDLAHPAPQSRSPRALAAKCLRALNRRARRQRHQDGSQWRPLFPFADPGAALRLDHGRAFIEKILLDRRTLARGYFREEGIRQLVNQHMTGEKNLARPLGALLTFELWHRLFID